MEEIKLLKQQMAEMYQAWLNGQDPSSSIPRLLTTNNPNPIQAQTNNPLYLPRFGPYANMIGVAGTSTMRPPNPSVINNPFFTFVAPATAGLQSTTQKNMGEPIHDLLYPPEMTFKSQNLYYHAHQHDSPIVIEKIVKNEEKRRWLGNVSYKYLCMFLDVHLPMGFKIPKFDKYEGYGDPMVHLRRYCNQLSGAGGKEKLLMAYFGKPFIEVLKMGEIIEDGIKFGRIVSFATLKAITQAIQKGSVSFGEKKNEEDASTIVVGQRERSRRPRRRRYQAQAHIYAQDPHNHSLSPLYSSPLPSYPVYNAQPHPF
ncbi:hypothetical protein P3S68_027305 [Capsicum galapagoense]